MQTPSVLITLVPLLDFPGCVPTEPIGRCLAIELLSAGKRVRVLAEGAQAKHWPAGIEVIQGSITRPAETPAAIENLSSLFLAGADPATAYEALHLAKAGGATKVVDLSSHGPDIEIALTPDNWHWLAIEVVVERSGMEWSHVVPSLIMAVTLTGSYPLAEKRWRDLVCSGQPIKRPSAHARFPFIHERDLAAVIANALQSEEFNGKKIHASGMLISDLERIQTLRDVLSKEVPFEQLSREQAIHYYKELGMQDHDIEYVLDTAEWFAEHTEEAHAESERILGRQLSTYAEWVREHESVFCMSPS